MPRLFAAVLAAVLTAFALPAFAEDPEDLLPPQARSLTGVLVSRAPDRVVVLDPSGVPHRIRVDSRTRYVWRAEASYKDFAPGAQVKAEYEASGSEPVATRLWILSPPSS